MNPTSIRSRLRGLHLACPLLAAVISAPATAEWVLDADAGVLYDSNLNRAYESADIRADGAFTLSAAGGSHFALSGADGLTLTASAQSEIYHRFHGLNLLGLGGTALYRHKFGLGYAAPWILLAASASHDNYREDIRDSDRVELRAEMGKRFTEAFDMAFGGRFERRYAKNDQPVVPGISGKVFDLRGQSAYARAGYAVSDPLLLGVELAVRRGDVVATTRPDFQIFAVSDAIAPDPTFGSDFFAYRLRGTTDTARLTASWAFDNRSSLNFAYADERTDATGGIV
ncbi:MAG TPA: hypothetical protein VF014_16480, partial [Casimicrobiaceae bacterium]|nr:hypothetical protein [Casimicrobiaceae bacterium]